MAKPKKASPPKAKGSQLDDVVAARRLGRNVTTRNVGDVQASGRDVLAMLRDPARSAEAAELLQRVAQEADPTKPGYEGNEIVLPFAQALMQLPTARRQALIQAAGNPPVFADLAGVGSGTLDDIPIDVAADAADAARAADAAEPNVGQADTMQAEAPAEVMGDDELLDFLNQADQSMAGDNDAIQRQSQGALELSRSPSTFAGSEFADRTIADARAAIDRDIPDMVNDGRGGRRPATPEEQEAARVRIIKDIVGPQQWNQLQAIEAKNRIPVLPPISRPTLEEVEARRARALNPKALLSGAGPQSIRNLEERLAGVEQLPVDSNMEQFGHVLDRRLALTPDELNALPNKVRMAYMNGEIATLDDLIAASPEDITDASSAMLGTARMPEPMAGGLIDKDEMTSAKAAALSRRASPYASVIEQIRHRMGMEPPRFSDEAPVALPSQDVKDNIVASLRDQLLEVNRRREAAALNPPNAAEPFLDRLDTMTAGTLGLQAPYSPGSAKRMTVDQQLDRSVRPESSRLIEKLYRAARQYGGDFASTDAPVSGADEMIGSAMADMELPESRGGGSPRNQIEVDLDQDFPEWRLQFAIPDGKGGFAVPQASLSGKGLARQIAGWYGVSDPDEFEATVWPVLEAAIQRQYNQPPSTQRAAEMAQTLLVPNMKASGRGQPGKGALFFNNPFGRTYVDQVMFDPRFPMDRPKATQFSQKPKTGIEGPRELPAGVLGDLLDRPVEGGDIDLDSVLDAPVADISASNALDLDSVLSAPVSDEPSATPDTWVPSTEELDAIFDQPVEGDIDLSMNKARRTPLSGLLV